jgi:hypothetical protein
MVEIVDKLVEGIKLIRRSHARRLKDGVERIKGDARLPVQLVVAACKDGNISALLKSIKGLKTTTNDKSLEKLGLDPKLATTFLNKQKKGKTAEKSAPEEKPVTVVADTSNKVVLKSTDADGKERLIPVTVHRPQKIICRKGEMAVLHPKGYAGCATPDASAEI